MEGQEDNFSAGAGEGLDTGSSAAQAGSLGEGQQDFSIPDEYKDKGWARFFDGKTGDDLKHEFFRSYDNSQTLIGKKVEDYIKNTDLTSLENFGEIKEALSKQIAPEYNVPENKEDYALNDILKGEDGNLEYEYPDEVIDYFGEQFKGLGLTKEQGQGLLKTYTDFELKEFQKYTNADDLENSLKSMFNETTGQKSQQRILVEGLLKEFLPQESQEFLQRTAPNYTIEMFYSVAKGLVDKYGYKEGSAGSSKPASLRMSQADKEAEYDRLYNKLLALDNNPNQKPGERDNIVNAMRKIFE